METRRRNRPVSVTVANGLLRPDMRLSVAWSAKPCARDPPRRASDNAASKACGRPCHGKPPGKDLPAPEATKRREAMQQHRLSRTPDSQS
jgi:hypothetical protein